MCPQNLFKGLLSNVWKKKKFIHSFSWIFNWKTTPSSFVPFYLLMPVQLIPRRKSSVSAHIPSSIKDPPVLSSPKAEDTHTPTPHSGNSPVHTHTALGKLSSSHTHTALGKLSSSHTHHTQETLQFTHTPHSGNSPVHTHTAHGKLSSSHTHFTWETLQFTNTPHLGNSPVHTHTTLGKLSSSHTHRTRETLQLLRPCCARMMNPCKSHTLSFFPVCCLAKLSPITKACLLTIPQIWPPAPLTFSRLICLSIFCLLSLCILQQVTINLLWATQMPHVTDHALKS